MIEKRLKDGSKHGRSDGDSDSRGRPEDRQTVYRIPLVDLRAQYHSIQSEIQEVIHQVLESGLFVLGPQVEAFERAFAEQCGVRWGVGVASGTDALILALRALGVGQGDEVITAANTFYATVSAIVAVGASPVLVDINPDYYTINPDAIEEAITNRTKAIIPVHLYGHAADMKRIGEVAERFGIDVIEDACQAHGAKFQEGSVGSFGALACFSFYPSKNLGAYGDGGIIVTNQEELNTRLQALRNYGQKEKYHHVTWGTNSRLDELQAAILLAKLRHLPEWIEARRHLAREYTSLLDGCGEVVCPVERRDARHVYHLYVIRHPNRSALIAQLASFGIQTAIHYPIPIHWQAAVEGTWKTPGKLATTEKVAGQILSLPLYPEMPLHFIEEVAQRIIESDQRL